MNAALADVRECATAKRLVEEELTASMRMARLAGSTVRDVAHAAGMSMGKVHGLTGVEGVIARALSVPGNAPVVRRIALISGGGDSTVLAHRSGECNCLAFASKGEPEFLVAMYPDWFRDEIEPLQAAARERGLEHWQWGWGAGEPPVGNVGRLCQGCEAARSSSVDVSNAPR